MSKQVLLYVNDQSECIDESITRAKQYKIVLRSQVTKDEVKV